MAELFLFSDLIEDGPKFRVLARVSVIKTEDGGRKGPFMSGYRPNHNFGDAENRSFYVGQITVIGNDWVYPGETRDIWVEFLYGRNLENYLVVGKEWRIQEGGKLVAMGQIIEVIEE
jgi:translation elongation factor EF-Tu-like GTPase